jgi:carbon monoxide dehydrogenase subunit G
VKIEQTVDVDAPLERVWALVNDVPRVAPCMPGGALTKVVDERTYEGTVQVKLGPIRMSYKGTVVLEEVDEARHSAVLRAKGRDVKGSGTAAANVTATLEPQSEARTKLHVSSDVQLTGKVASFGRGAIQDVAGKLFGQFAQCLKDTLDAEQAAATAPARAPAEAPAEGAPRADRGQPPATPTEPGKPAEEQPPPGPPAEGDREPRPGTPPSTPTEPGRPAGSAAALANAPSPGSPGPGPGPKPRGPRGGRPPGLEDAPGWPSPGADATAGAAPPRPAVQATAPTAGAPLEVGGLIGSVVGGRLKATGAWLAALARGLYLRVTRRRA